MTDDKVGVGWGSLLIEIDLNKNPLAADLIAKSPLF